jgi:hypothetical protein
MTDARQSAPSDAPDFTRIDAISEAPWELGEYERWLAQSTAPSEEYLFAEAKARFQAADEDVVVKLDELTLSETEDDVELGVRGVGAGLRLPKAKRAPIERILTLMDGTRTIAEIAFLAGAERGLFQRLLSLGLGSVLFVPKAVTELEARLSGAELVRFVGTPYELVRNYWRNMIDVRSAAEATLSELASTQDFVVWLRRLHVLALMGKTLDCFYRPASRIAGNAVRPGRLYSASTRSVRTPERTLLLAGPRVGVGFVGGPHYHALLAAHDPQALAPERELIDDNDVPWGRVVTGRALDDATDAAWFCPPRPATPEHFSALFIAYFEALEASKRGDESGTLRELARFHHRFVRLHPFRCANQSLAMNLVNLVLCRSHGAGIPHLMLDQFALRLSEAAYVGVFSRAVRAHAFRGPPVERWAKLRARKAAAYALIERLQHAPDLAAARKLAAADPDGAGAALLSDR